MTELSSHRANRTVVALAAVLVVALMTASPSLASANGAASSGSFDEYASGPGLGYTDISGHAQLVRTGNGRTIATVEIKGLTPGQTYAVHVHAGTCANAASPHYFFDDPVPAGDGPNGDEIWPGPVTANAAGNARGKTTVGATAGPTAQSLVVHATPTGGDRIACANLS